MSAIVDTRQYTARAIGVIVESGNFEEAQKAEEKGGKHGIAAQ